MAVALKPFEKGEPRTLLEAAEANRIIDMLNAWANCTISPQGLGSFKVSDQNVILDLNPLVAHIADEVVKKLILKVACGTDGSITASLSTKP